MKAFAIVPIVLSICMSLSGCPKLTISFGDETNQPQDAYDQKVEFEYSVQDGTLQQGSLGGNDIIISTFPAPDAYIDPQATITPTKPSESTTPTTSIVAPDSIVGDWVSARRNDQIIYVSIYSFYADGTYSEQDIEYTHVSYNPSMFGENQTGWQGIPMGFPYYTGTYTVQGDTITMSCTSDTYEVFNPPIVSSMKIVSLSADTGIFYNSNAGAENTYIRNFPTSDAYVEELCALLGIDTSV